MNYVAQRHAMSCGVAAVANVVGISYDEAAKVFDMKYAETRGYFCKSIVTSFAKLGKQYRFAKYTAKSAPLAEVSGAVIFIEQSLMFPYGHWVARADNVWVDSWINLQEEKDPRYAKAGVHTKLPGRPQWIVYPV